MSALGSSSRKGRRKEARKDEGRKRSQSWALHQAFKKTARKKTRAAQAQRLRDLEFGTQRSRTVVNTLAKVRKSQKYNRTKRKSSRTKFEEFLDMENLKTITCAQEELAMERKLAKKLKLKEGKLRGPSDGLSELLEGTVPSLDVFEDKWNDHKLFGKKPGQNRVGDEEVAIEDRKSSFKRESTRSDKDVEYDMVGSSGEEETPGKDSEIDDSIESMSELEDSLEENGEGQAFESENAIAKADIKTNPCTENSLSKQTSVKYVAPHLRDRATDSNEGTQVHRRIRGLLNRLSAANVESLAQELSVLFQEHGRRIVTENVTNEILWALCSGPRGNEQYAAVFAAFVAGIASSVGMDFGAKFMASLADNFEDQYRRGDGLALRNITLMLSYLYTFKLIASDLVFDLMRVLCKRLEELDVATILVILQSCGIGLRADDPAAMKGFFFDAQGCSEELKAAALQAGSSVLDGKRMQFMLETIIEIKNNKRRAKPESTNHVRLTKWLQKLRVEDVHLRGLKWKRLIDPEKKGQWWITGAADEQQERNTVVVADIIDKEVVETEKMLNLASSQRMNTDIRRAVFCVIMSGEDYLDAFEKILRLKLAGKQDREVLRVIVECCLQEKVFNKYYSLLAAKLCHHDKNHRFTLQYCLWDQFKQLNSMDTRRIANLAHLLADLIGTYTLPLSVVKVVDFSDLKAMTPKIILHFHIFLKILLTDYSDEIVWNAFSRIACTQELESLCHALSVFIHQFLIKEVKADDDLKQKPLLLQRCHMAKKALANSADVELE